MKCVLCDSLNSADKALSDGSYYHENCYEELRRKWEELDLSAQNYRREFLSLRQHMGRLESEIASIFSFFRRDSLGRELEQVQQTIDECLSNESQVLAAALNIKKEMLEPLWDYWLDYPPDWHERSSDFLEERWCEQCGAYRRLQTHHVMPLSKGGSNLPSNFAAVCRECHEAHHHGFKGGGKGGSQFSKHLKVITDAISRSSRVEIRYKAADGDKTKRTIRPMELISLEFENHDGQSLCVRAHYELRGAERVFAIRRVTKAVELN